MMTNAFSWTKINKGDRRPEGHVLVAYSWEERNFTSGEKVTYWGYTGAYWHKGGQYWVADYGKPIKNVSHWVSLPDDPE